MAKFSGKQEMNKKSDPARDAFRKLMSETDWANASLFGDGVSLRLHAARSGDSKALIDAFEAREFLNEAELKWLAENARGNARIERRKLDQQIKEYKIVFLVAQYMAQGATQYAASKAVLDNHPELDMNEETLRTYLRKWKNRI